MRASALLLVALSVAGAGPTPKEVWIEVKSPHFRVVANGGERQARQTAAQFERFREVLRQVFPKAKVDSPKPLTILAVRDEGGLKALLPEYWETKGRTRPAGIFQSGPDRDYIALRTDVRGEYPFHVVYHEFVHSLLQLNWQKLPLWLNEGLAEFFGHAVLGEKESGVGQPSVEQLAYLQQKSLLPLEAILTADHGSPYYNEQSRSGLFYAQSWALTHYLILGDRRAHLPQLSRYLQLIEAGGTESEAIAAAFGSVRELESKLQTYIRYSAYFYLRVPIKLDVEENSYPSQTLTTPDFLAIAGDFYTHTRRPAEALASATEAVRLDPNNAAAHESLGFIHLRGNNESAAAREFAKAVACGSAFAPVHYYLGVLESHGGDVPTPETPPAAHYRRALDLQPDYAPAVTALIATLSNDGSGLEEAHSLAVRLVTVQPQVPRHRLVLARLLLQMGRKEEAVRFAEEVRKVSPNAADVLDAERLLSVAGGFGGPSPGSAPPGTQGPDRFPGRARLQRSQTAPAPDQAPVIVSDPTEGITAVRAKHRDRGTGTSWVEGTVVLVECPDPLLVVVVAQGNRQWRLHSCDFYSLNYLAYGWKPEGNIYPCRDLQGQRVRVEVAAIPDPDYEGEIVKVEIHK